MANVLIMGGTRFVGPKHGMGKYIYIRENKKFSKISPRLSSNPYQVILGRSINGLV